MAGALVVAVVFAALAVHQGPSPAVVDVAPRLVRVKPADAELRRLVLSGHARSATFRALMDEIHHTNVVVVIQFGLCAKGRVRSCVSHVEGDSRQRHIAVKVNTRTTDDRLIATIAHELHHALEIAREPDVTNSAQALALYRRIAIGRCGEGLDERCETEAALQIEARVNEELARGPRGQ
jgi:predicted solute-binding protein